jgi:hypothetical protein
VKTQKGDEAIMSTIRSQIADLDLDIDKLEETVSGGGPVSNTNRSVSDTLRNRGTKSKEPTGE